MDHRHGGIPPRAGFLRQHRDSPWLLDNEQLRIVSPMLQLDRLVGFVVLYDPPPPFELTYEDRDLLKTLGRHVASHIAQQDADRRLAESRQFEAYNRLTAFMMHDLKNSVAQLKLIVANAPRHKHKPEFIDDAMETIANAADRMTKLIEQLRGSTSADRHVEADVARAGSTGRVSLHLSRAEAAVAARPARDGHGERRASVRCDRAHHPECAGRNQ